MSSYNLRESYLNLTRSIKERKYVDSDTDSCTSQLTDDIANLLSLNDISDPTSSNNLIDKVDSKLPPEPPLFQSKLADSFKFSTPIPKKLDIDKCESNQDKRTRKPKRKKPSDAFDMDEFFISLDCPKPNKRHSSIEHDDLDPRKSKSKEPEMKKKVRTDKNKASNLLDDSLGANENSDEIREIEILDSANDKNSSAEKAEENKSNLNLLFANPSNFFYKKMGNERHSYISQIANGSAGIFLQKPDWKISKDKLDIDKVKQEIFKKAKSILSLLSSSKITLQHLNTCPIHELLEMASTHRGELPKELDSQIARVQHEFDEFISKNVYGKKQHSYKIPNSEELQKLLMIPKNYTVRDHMSRIYLRICLRTLFEQFFSDQELYETLVEKIIDHVQEEVEKKRKDTFEKLPELKKIFYKTNRKEFSQKFLDPPLNLKTLKANFEYKLPEEDIKDLFVDFWKMISRLQDSENGPNKQSETPKCLFFSHLKQGKELKNGDLWMMLPFKNEDSMKQTQEILKNKEVSLMKAVIKANPEELLEVPSIKIYDQDGKLKGVMDSNKIRDSVKDGDSDVGKLAKEITLMGFPLGESKLLSASYLSPDAAYQISNMNKILKFKSNLLHNIASNPDLKVKKILYDTKFLLYCFRHFKYADNNFNLKVSESILNNFDRYQDLGEKMRAIRLFTQLHLNNNLKISQSHSELLSSQLKDIQQFPNFRWLLNLAILNHNSCLENEDIWKKIELAYKSRNFIEDKVVSPEDQVKLALIMGLTKRSSIELWRSLISDLISNEEEFNPSQRIILIKALTSFDSTKVFEKSFEEEKFKPFVSALISRAILSKENLSLKETISLLLAAEKSETLGEKALSEIEPILFSKVKQIPKENIFLISQYYTRVMMNKKRMEFLKSLRQTFLSKLDRKITLSEAIQFNTMNNYLLKNGIIGSIEYNEPYQEFIITGQYPIFEYLYLAKMRNMSFNEVMTFSFLIQGQLSKHLFKLTPETLYRTLSFLEFRGDISDNFVSLVISVANKYLKKNDREDPKNLFFSNLVLIKYDSNIKKNTLSNVLSEIRSLILKDKDHNLEEEFLIYILNNSEAPKEVKSIVEDIIKCKFSDISENSLFEHLSLLSLERIKADEAFKNKVVEYVAENFDYLKVGQLCKIPHIVSGLLPTNLQERFSAKIKEKTLALEEVESLTRNIGVLNKALRGHVQNSLLALKGNINVSNLDTVFITTLRIFGDSQDFDKKFIQQLMQVITTRNSYLNQKNLNKFIEAYSKLEK